MLQENLHHKPSQKIPVPNGKGNLSSNEHQHKSSDSSHSELITKLDDDYLLESRASSITVSEQYYSCVVVCEIGLYTYYKYEHYLRIEGTLYTES